MFDSVKCAIKEINDIVVACPDLSGKEPHRQVDMGIVMISGHLCGEVVAHWPTMPEMWVRVPL